MEIPTVHWDHCTIPTDVEKLGGEGNCGSVEESRKFINFLFCFCFQYSSFLNQSKKPRLLDYKSRTPSPELPGQLHLTKFQRLYDWYDWYDSDNCVGFKMYLYIYICVCVCVCVCSRVFAIFWWCNIEPKYWYWSIFE